MKTTTTLALLLCTGICTHAQSYIDRYLTDPLTYTTVVNGSNQVVNPRDLDFKPNTNELWVMMRGNGNNGGDFVIVHNAGLPNQTSEYRKDSHSSHFMTNASAMAFSDIGEWAAVSEIQNTAGGNSTFMGPALWLGDLNIFATVFQSAWVSGKPLGSHIDMLHQSPYAMGIAWDTDKAYWVMDGHNGNIARYDFVQDHGPGYDDHSAGGIKRYTDVTVTRVPNVPSHMVMDHANNWLYFIDGGAKKIKRMNTTTGTIVGNLTVPGTATETLMAGYKNVTGATVETIDTWTGSARPCGIDYADGRLIVSDNFNGDIKVYDVTGTPTLLGTIATGQSTMMGVKIGTDGSIWFVNNYEGQVVRINAAPVANDAAITAIASPATVSAKPDFFSNAYDVCSGSVAPSVTLTNAGSNTLTSVVIDADIDGVSASFTWTGSLGVGNSTNVVLPVATIGTGSHLLTVTTGSTNGTSDPNPMNDRKEGSFRSIDAPLSVPFVETFGGSTFPPTDWNYVHFNPNDFISHNTTTGGFGLSTGCAKMDNYSGSMNITGQEDYLMLPRPRGLKAWVWA